MAGALTACALLAVELAVPPARAAAPQQRVQVAGWYRMMLGDFEVTALLDGTHPFPVDEVMTHATHEQLDQLLASADTPRPVEGPINAFLINTGSRLVLIDSGAGTLYGECCGHLIANLRAAGYQPEQVDDIFLTHLHRDHVGGINARGQMAFPNATLHISRTDADYWTSRDQQKLAPAFLGSMFDGAIESLQPYLAAHRVQTFVGGVDLLPGLRAMPSAGHTPGHTAYVVESRGQKLVVWGDVVHVAPIQFPAPGIRLKYDSDQDQAEQVRRQLFAEAAQQGQWVAAAHIAFPGIGHILARDGRYDWAPAAFTSWLPAPAAASAPAR